MRLFLTQIFFVFLTGIVLGVENQVPLSNLSLDQKVGLSVKIGQENPKLCRAMLLGLLKDYKADFEKNEKLLTQTYFNLGNCDLMEKDFDKAMLWYEQSLGINPNYVPALVFKGKYCFLKSRFQDARNIYKQAEAIDPNDKILKKNIAQLETYLKEHPEAEDQSECLKAKTTPAEPAPQPPVPAKP